MERRKLMWDSLQFDENLEFDKADIGLAGGRQTTQMKKSQEKGSGGEIHDRSADRIQRFAGEPNPLLPWPVKEKLTKDVDARFGDCETQLVKLRKTLASLSSHGGGAKLTAVSEDGPSSDKKTSECGES